MGETLLQLTPADAGRRMTLEEFEHAESPEGLMYELEKGEVILTDVPDPKHFARVHRLKRAFFAYDLSNPEVIKRIGTGSECKILLDAKEGPSERHPDIALYKTDPPAGGDVWRFWIPELVVEVVSGSSVRRDYDQKPGEYLQFGVKEYWIVDNQRDEIAVLVRGAGDWVRRTVRSSETLSTRQLPGFALDVAAIFKAD